MSPLPHPPSPSAECPNGDPGAAVRTFEGRPLTRPDEEIQDQGLTFDIATLATRRRFLGLLGAGTTTAVLAACFAPSATPPSARSTDPATTAPSGDEMPTETAGPYPADGSNGPDVLEITGIERGDIRASIDGPGVADGVPITLTMNLVDLSHGGAYAGATVYLWQADAQGRYSMYSRGVTEETYLRGVQVAGPDGTVTFTTVFPGCYAGRWPHLHFEVFPDAASVTDATTNVLTSQVAMPESECAAVHALEAYAASAPNLAGVSLAGDGIFADGWDLQVPAFTGSPGAGYTMTLAVPIDPTTPQAGSGRGRRP